MGYATGHILPDYRGGLNYAHLIGRSLNSESSGWFADTAADAVFISRFGNDFLIYDESRIGYSTGPLAFRMQFFWNGNFTIDTQRQIWANFLETGLGVRFRAAWMPPSMYVTASLLRGAYPLNTEGTRPANFNDFRSESGMRLLVSALLAAVASAASLPYYCVLNADAGAWPEILSSIGLVRQPANLAHVFVARSGTPASNEWNQRVDQGAILILEGESSLAEMFGFRRGAGFVKAGSLTDVHRPGLAIVWEKGLELPVSTCLAAPPCSPASAGPARP